MSPYIITTTVPVPGIAGAGFGGDKPPAVSRRAVATLEEAAYDAIRLMSAEGGTVGPLPDGTTIEVHRANWDALYPAWNASDTVHTVIAAFNDAQETQP